MSDYRIEKLRRELTVILSDGSRIEGEVFLRPVSRHRARPEEPVDMLNDAEPFFVISRSGEAVLVNKAAVTRVVTSYPEAEEEDFTALGIQVEVVLTDGTVCAGSIFLESRSDRPRLLDYLNAYRDPFLPLVEATQVQLVNTHFIAHVREVA